MAKVQGTITAVTDSGDLITSITPAQLDDALTEAKRQLVFTNLAIGEIAYDLAFADPSHFGRFFKKQTGKTPQEFRAGRRG